MLRLEGDHPWFEGPQGTLPVLPDDEVTRKLAMLIEGECQTGPLAAARKFGYSKPRYYQLLSAYHEHGAVALKNAPRGPKSNYRRTDAVVRQVIRYRFLDPDASADVIAQKLRQTGWSVSTRSVERILSEYGLQKKTLRVSPRR
jgi:transposase